MKNTMIYDGKLLNGNRCSISVDIYLDSLLKAYLKKKKSTDFFREKMASRISYTSYMARVDILSCIVKPSILEAMLSQSAGAQMDIEEM